MKILFTDEFLIQYDIIKRLALNGNIDFSNLAKQISLCIKVMHEADNDTAPVLKKHLRPHKGAKKEGYLAPPNDKCISIDLDGEHRLVAYRNGNEAIIISSICHYDTVEKKLLFNDLDSIAKRIKKELSTGGLDLLDPASLAIKEEILLSVKDIDSSAYEIDFNNICPSSPNVYIHNLKRCIKTSVEDNSYYGQETSKEGKNSTIRAFFQNNHDFLERTIVNARCFNNVASVVCGNGDLKETALLKLELQENLLKNIADVFAFVDNSHLLSLKEKNEIFGELKDTVLNAFNDRHDSIIYGTNESSPEYVLARAIDKSFQDKINNDSNLENKSKNKKNALNKRISKESLFEFEYKDISDKKIKVKSSSPESFYSLAKNYLWNNFIPSKLWNTFFPSKKNKAKNSASPENKIVKQEENITKTDKNVKEAQTVDKDNSVSQEQEKTVMCSRMPDMYKSIQEKNKRAEASKEVEVNEETQEEDPAVARRNVMKKNIERMEGNKKNNTLGNVNSAGKKGRRAL